MRSNLLGFLLIIFSLGVSVPFEARNNDTTKPFIVVLDAGHGGKDPGNLGNGYKEKDIALDVVKRVGKILEKDERFKVIYTRTTDTFLELHERAAIANRYDADVFVSIHCNSHHTQAHGAETFVMGLNKSDQNLDTAKKENEVIFLEDNYEEIYAGFDPRSPETLIGLSLMQEEYLDQSIMLAGLIQNNMVNNLRRKNRGVKQDVWWVLHNTYMPSVLVELGFLTHNSEGHYVNSQEGRKDMSEEIAKGIVAYRDNIMLATANNVKPKITEKQVEEVTESVVKNIYPGIEFKVQLAAGKRKISLKPAQWNGLVNISRNQEDGLYKYYYGATSDYNEIQIMKGFTREKGYSSSYVVAFRDGQKIPLQEALKSRSN
ncbi:N-acetylmuramoyl-L-alanine amidase family protein [Aureitalea marina]|uniref:N-acetylmuramoyl-L-alanine amidase n=1 Tax=Aureitalea marina TaxID=930804 RepID=A0A2S7KP57_9FLAO|nr:N-acetylmuramoyl-L-alanine amidase [Aureitalea marina]PQB04353.1 N-acetylmuramoyl-L-alanine amidase [Aureitalea marina]